jgi:hypothetical protein
MTDLYLAFTDEAAANAVLFTQEPTEWDEEGNATAFEPRQCYANIDTIGIIYKPTGETLQGEDGPYPEMAPIEGWHVNVRLVNEDAAALEPFVVEPNTPVRVWG